MRFLIVLVLVLFVAHAPNYYYPYASATVVPAGACNGDRTMLTSCFDQLIDTDHNAEITTTELEAAFVALNSCLPSQQQWRDIFANTTFILEQCDTDSSGTLNMTDWNSADSCLQDPYNVEYLCRLCYMCGYNATK